MSQGPISLFKLANSKSSYPVLILPAFRNYKEGRWSTVSFSPAEINFLSSLWHNAIIGVYQSTLNSKKEFPNKSYHTERKFPFPWDLDTEYKFYIIMSSIYENRIKHFFFLSIIKLMLDFKIYAGLRVENLILPILDNSLTSNLTLCPLVWKE